VSSGFEAAGDLSIERTDEDVAIVGRSRRRRWVVTVCVVAAVLLLLLTPPLLNVNRLKRRIAASISASLGRPVQLDGVTMHLLPVPGFTLQNFVVSEDPAFGAEPIIRANVVDVTLRPSSLWRRHVEFSSMTFETPSLNLVRNGAGVWNVQSLLMHAASVSTAPTAQRKAGPEPRFPYIEATGARVNVKLGEEKKPFSLTDADFALWLTTPQEWRVRAKGTPTRTDTNISDPGVVRLEGSLKRAATMAEVPVDLTASWTGAPMGEASKLLSGQDAGWRGNLNVEASLLGMLGAAKLTTTIHMEELRRSEFVPLEAMDVRAECRGTLDVTAAVVKDPDCAVSAPVAEGSKVAGRVVAIADRLDLSTQETAGMRVGMTNVPNAWLLDWARLFSQRIPAGERPEGTVAGSVLLASARKKQPARWEGDFRGEIVGLLPWGAESANLVHTVTLMSKATEEGFVLTPLGLTPPGRTPALTLSGTATKSGYALHFAGTATDAQVQALRALAPPLGDGLQEVLKPDGSVATGKDGTAKGEAARVMKVDAACTRTWGSGQTCEAGEAAVAKRRSRR
jgi:AsmA family